MKHLYKQHPCKDCPFRKDSLDGWLGRKRMEEIMEAGSFVCHKDNSRQCAGHMLLSPHNLFVRYARIMRMELDLKGRELVFDSPQKCIDHHG